MKNLRTGTLSLKNTVVLKQAEGGMRRIRCPKCQQLAAPAMKASGKQVYRCACGTEYSVHGM